MNEKEKNITPIELLEIRSTLTESLLFGALRKETFEEIFKKLETVYLENEILFKFLESKKLQNEFEQFCELGSSD
ncbi:MAG: hypothetical protein MUF77_11720 [Leptospira sp.]|jgi:hypothetical protein|nr:hypothetical protein [Leptospira sp.]